jgi:hypothetical protein
MISHLFNISCSCYSSTIARKSLGFALAMSVSSKLVVLRSDAPPVFGAAEEVLDLVSAAIEALGTSIRFSISTAEPWKHLTK